MKTTFLFTAALAGMMALAPATYHRAAAEEGPTFDQAGKAISGAAVTAYEGTRDRVLQACD